MKVEIRHLKTLSQPNGELIEIVEVNAQTMNAEQIQTKVGSALISKGIELFGSEFQSVGNNSIFGGYVRNKANGECIIAV
jgi:hypothetical protein